MKRYSFLLVMLLCLPQLNHAGDEIRKTVAFETSNILVAGVGLIASVLSYTAGKYNERSSKQAELEHKRLEQEAKQKREDNLEKKKNSIFHYIEHMKREAKTFEPFLQKPHSEQWSDTEQQQFAQEVIATAGSITAFDQRLDKNIKRYETLNQETATTHEDIGDHLSLLQRFMNTNPYVIKKRNAEREEAFKWAQQEASLKKVEYEAQAAQNLAAATAQTEQLARQLSADTTNAIQKIESNTQRCSQQLVDQMYNLRSMLNRSLTALNDWQECRVSEHREMVKLLNKLLKKGDLTRQDIASLKERLILLAQAPVPSAPEYPSCSPPHQNPPPYNPEYASPAPSAPEYPSYAPPQQN